MKGDWPSIVLGGIAASCGIYVRVRLWGDMPEELGFTIYAMIFLGLLIVLMNIRGMMKERNTMKMKNERLPVECPACDSKTGLRFTNESGGLRLTCIACKEVDEDLDPNKIFSCLIALVQYSSDNDGMDHETLAGIVLEKLGVPEFEEEADAAE